MSKLLASGPHGLTEMVYAYTSAANNNGSAFAGISANTQWYNTTLGIAMLVGRFFTDHPGPGHRRLARSASRRSRRRRAPSVPTPPLFAGLLVAVTVIAGRARPTSRSLALGPIVEHLAGHF